MCCVVLPQPVLCFWFSKLSTHQCLEEVRNEPYSNADLTGPVVVFSIEILAVGNRYGMWKISEDGPGI